MKLTNHSSVPVYTISGSSTARPLPEWLVRKRKRSLKQDPEYASRIELLQDFEFQEASSCIRVSDDGDWVVSTGTYKPQMHVHYLPHLSLSYARHTDALNQTFLLLSSDYSKSLHLQSDRFLEFHTPQGCHYSTRIPRYGRDLKYDKRSAEALIPCVGVDANGSGEVYRLNLELGRFMKAYDVDVGGDDYSSYGGGALQGGINAGSVNSAAIGENSHNLLAFGTSIGTVEFWDSRSRSRVGVLPPPSSTTPLDTRAEITSLEFKSSGLILATGSSTGLIHLYDLRSPVPLLRKDQGYGYPIHTLNFLESSANTARNLSATDKILSSDRRIIKIWDATTGDPWTSVEPAVDINSVAWCKDSGMLLTANEGRQQHSFFIPSLGPAPKWCSFLDNLVEEMAEDTSDPAAFSSGVGGHKPGEIYDNYRFVAVPELRALNLDHLIGTTGLLKPMMHGYLVNQRLYEEARLISQPELWAERRQKSIKERIEKERESRIRGTKKAVTVKVNKRLAERMLEREDKNERRKAKRALAKATPGETNDTTNGIAVADAPSDMEEDESHAASNGPGLLKDPRFASLFQDEEFAVDETSYEFRALNASTRPDASTATSARRDPTDPRRLTAVEQEALAVAPGSSSDVSSDESSRPSDDEAAEAARSSRRPVVGKPNKFARRGKEAAEGGRISTASYQRAGHRSKEQREPEMRVSDSGARGGRERRAATERSFGTRAAGLSEGGERRGGTGSRGGGFGVRGGGVVGERQITFEPSRSRGGRGRDGEDDGARGGDGSGGGGRGRGRGRGDSRGRGGRGRGRGSGDGQARQERRSASGNVFRNM